ncbi:hypothetical protein F2Q69_00025150 [Brassica cretica]|uniref:Disease resistance N-terminal domain-containing protein n=1 Tax=Brassica cretica TaxID=69181 RepID=A0A8S9QCF9_BRACR|nr:hypothetical protein F2Q69_00025150 [Brassica cretica]
MVCSRGGFPQLQKLRFDGLNEWEEWIVEEGSMPLLHTLHISYCRKLKVMKSLFCCDMAKGWKKRLQQLKETLTNYRLPGSNLCCTNDDSSLLSSKRRLMAESLLPFAVKRLWNLLVQETEQFQGVEEQFEGLKSDVKNLRCFLEDAEAKKHTSAMVKDTMSFGEMLIDFVPTES